MSKPQKQQQQTDEAEAEDEIDPKLFAKLKAMKPPVIPEDKLDQIRDKCKAMRMLTLEIKDLKLNLEQKQKALTKLSTVTLPDLFAEHNIPSITLGAEGNLPAMTLEKRAFYKAVLPDDSDAGLRWLERNKHGDLIKRVFTIKLPMDSAKQATQVRNLVQKLDLAYEEKETVPWTTLTAFVKEMIEKRRKAVPLGILGAVIGQIVKVKPQRQEK